MGNLRDALGTMITTTPDKTLLLICYLLVGAACFLMICGTGPSGTAAGTYKMKLLFNIGSALLLLAALLALLIMLFPAK